jgi:hypothetical protein
MFAKGKSVMTIIAMAMILCAGANLSLYAQAIDGNLTGAVVDSSGARVPNASVELTNSGTGIKTTTKTGVDGTYQFNNVPIGKYDISVTASGFAVSGLKNVVVELNKTATANITMSVQGVAEEVSVVESARLIDTTTAQLQSTFKADQIVNLPIIEAAGNFFGALNLSMLSSGVTSNGGVGQGTGPSVGGQRPIANNYMVEGVDNNDKGVTGPLVYVPTDATQEFSLLQNEYSAEFGHSTGGQFQTVVKSGDNNTHGSLYEYFQNRKLNAMDQAFKRQGFTENPRYDQNRMGGSVGGPIVRNKWFYFGDFEYAPLGAAVTTSTPVKSPTAAGYALLDAMPALNAAGTSGISKQNLTIFKQYVAAAPVANDTTTVNGVTIPIGIMPLASANYTNQYVGVASSDYNFSEKDQLRGRFIFNRLDQLDNLANLPQFWTTLPTRNYLATLAEYHTISPKILNELRFGFNRHYNNYVVPDFKFPGLDQFPNLQFDNDLGLQLGPDPNAPQYTFINTYQLVDNVAWTKGKHSIKFGFDFRREIAPQLFVQRKRGDYDYADLNEYLQDQIPSDLAERNIGDVKYYGNQWATYLYGEDHWRIVPHFTVTMGLRWERTTIPQTMNLQTLNSVANVPGVLTFNAPKAASKNFAPRIGLAYSPGNKGTTSIRAGFGLAYDVIFDNVGLTAYPPQLSATFDAGDYPSVFKVPFLAKGGIYPGSIAAGGSLSQTDARAATSSYIPDQVLPYSMQWHLGVQHEIAHDYTVEVRYLGTRGVHLLVQNQMDRIAPVQPNSSLPTYLSAPTQAALDALPLTLAQLQAKGSNPILGPLGFSSKITWWPPIGNSFYHGLATQLTKRLSHGVQLTGAYTWSHNIDDSTATHFTTYLTPRREMDFQNLRLDKSNSALDRRHRLTFNWVYNTQWFEGSSNWFQKNLLGNWRWVGTYTYESPEFVTAQSGLDSNLNGDSAGDRTVYNPSGNPLKGSDVTPLQNSSGATVAYLAKDPTAMYIKAGAGAFPNTGRNTLPTRPTDNFDMSIAKKFVVREGQTLELRGDFANIFNHAQYVPGYINSVRPNSSYNTARDFLVPGNANFAKWDEIFSSSPRSVQIAVRYVF